MDYEKINTQMKKGVLEYLILAVIAKGEVYASDILSTLKDSKLLIVEWTLYPLLSRLKDDRLVTYSRVESLQWPPRKYYTLTPRWAETLETMRETRWILANAVKTIDRTK